MLSTPNNLIKNENKYFVQIKKLLVQSKLKLRTKKKNSIPQSFLIKSFFCFSFWN